MGWHAGLVCKWSYDRTLFESDFLLADLNTLQTVVVVVVAAAAVVVVVVIIIIIIIIIIINNNNLCFLSPG
jgi:hypothetical protein